MYKENYLGMDKVIFQNDSIRDALVELNTCSEANAPFVLFVVDSEQHLQGSLTDGDIRRFLVAGGNIEMPVTLAMNAKCRYVDTSDKQLVLELHKLKQTGINVVPVVDENHILTDVCNLQHYNNYLPLDAVLMAGGKGVRLRPLTETTPKPLLPVGGKPIIDYNIDSLMENGIKHISVTVNYLHEQLEEHFAQPVNGVKVDCIKEPQFLGTMGATQFVQKFYNNEVLVMNSDLFTNIDFEDFYLHFKEHNADMSVAAVPYSISVPYGIFELEGRNIKGVKEKPVYNYFANAGIYLIKRELLENMPKNTFYNATDLMNDAVAAGKTVIRYPITGYWLDIGSHEEYKKANELVKHIKK